LIEKPFWKTLNDQHADSSDRVWGAAYRIEASKVAEVQEYLDIREINGYSMQYTPFYPADPSINTIRCLVYIGLPDNPQFLGSQDPQALAEHISRSRGPSGENVEYLLMLEEALKELGPESGDEHIQDLADRVRKLQSAGEAGDMASTEDAVKHEVAKVNSGEGAVSQEEVEN
jgi:cation transport protein ChaC